MSELLTVREISERTNFSPYRVRVWLKKGLLKGYKPSGSKYSHWRIKETDLVEFINGRQ